MANPYRHIFRHPGTKAFVVASLIARVTVSMTAIGIITMLSEQGRSYWLSGAIMAAFTLSMALISPQISRAVDRFGQSKILPYMAAISSCSMLLLLACSHYQAPVWTLFLFALLSGCMPSLSAMARARWTAIYRGTPHLHTAFSFESVMDEVCFIFGPPLSVGLSVGLFPEAGPLLAALLLILGVTLFVRQKATEPPLYPHPIGDRRSVIRLLPMQLLVLALIGLGTNVGAIDVISVAFAKLLGEPAEASIVLIFYGLGSCLMGLIFGTLKLKASLPRLFLYASFVTALTTLPLLLVTNIGELAIVMLIAGLSFAPTMIVAMGLVEHCVPASKLTEGLTWMGTGLGLGVALGSWVAGWVMDVMGIAAGFWVIIVAGIAILLVATMAYPPLSRISRSTPH